jgi:hypothetical protein
MNFDATGGTDGMTGHPSSIVEIKKSNHCSNVISNAFTCWATDSRA